MMDRRCNSGDGDAMESRLTAVLLTLPLLTLPLMMLPTYVTATGRAPGEILKTV